MRAPRTLEQQLTAGVRAQQTFGAGNVDNAGPISDRNDAIAEASAQTADASQEDHYIDQFTCAGGAQDFTFTYLPSPGSWNVSVSGVTLLDGVGYTVTNQTLNLLSAADARSGEVVQVQYDYLTGQPAVVPSDPNVDASLYLPLSEASGSVAADASGNAHDGTINGTMGYHATSLRADGDNYAMTFGGDDFIDVPWGAWMEATDFTVECFIKTTDSGASFPIIVSRDQIGAGWRLWHLRMNTTGKLQFEVISPSVVDFTSTASINGGVNRHVAAVFNPSANAVKLYIDGALDSSTAYSTAIGSTAPARLSVGCGRTTSGDTASQFWNGTIDEVGYHTRALDASEIAALAGR